MPGIAATPIPAAALLQRYAGSRGYADCYRVDVPGRVALERLVVAFYTSRLFRVERAILALVAKRPSTDDDVRSLAAGRTSTFSAWRVEARTDDGLLLADVGGSTRSWLGVAPNDAAEIPGTTLYFGSAVVAKVDPATGARSMGAPFALLLGFHKLYSRALLRAARANLGG